MRYGFDFYTVWSWHWVTVIVIYQYTLDKGRLWKERKSRKQIEKKKSVTSDDSWIELRAKGDSEYKETKVGGVNSIIIQLQ